MKNLLIAGVIAAMGCGQVGAQVVYETIADNIGVSTNSLQQQYQAGGAFAQSFQAGSNLSTIGDGDGNGQVVYTFRVHLAPYEVIVDLVNGTVGYVSTNFTLQLFSNSTVNGGQPDSLLQSQYSVTETVAGPGVQSFSFQADPFLQPGTDYWVRISAQPISTTIYTMAGVYGTTSPSSTGIGSFGAAKYFDGRSWTNSPRYVMSIQAESVPEPSSAGLLILGMGCLLAKRRRGGR